MVYMSTRIKQMNKTVPNATKRLFVPAFSKTLLASLAFCSVQAFAAPIAADDGAAAALRNMQNMQAANSLANLSAAGDMGGIRSLGAMGMTAMPLKTSAGFAPAFDTMVRPQNAGQFASLGIAGEEAEGDWLDASRTLAILFVGLVVVSLRLRAMSDRGNRVH
jgi:hypothetical protein